MTACMDPEAAAILLKHLRNLPGSEDAISKYIHIIISNCKYPKWNQMDISLLMLYSTSVEEVLKHALRNCILTTLIY